MTEILRTMADVPNWPDFSDPHESFRSPHAHFSLDTTASWSFKWPQSNKLLNQFGLTVEDIGLWKLNEAFAVQVLYCQDQFGIPEDRLNANDGAIAIGIPAECRVRARSVMR